MQVVKTLTLNNENKTRIKTKNKNRINDRRVKMKNKKINLEIETVMKHLVIKTRQNLALDLNKQLN